MFEFLPVTILTIKKFIIRVTLILMAFCMNGCNTMTLWDHHPEVVQSPPSTPGKPYEMFINQMEKKICISYYSNDGSNSKDISYLVIDEGIYLNPIRPRDNMEILNDIFSDDSHFQISSIIASAQQREKSNFFVLVFLGQFNDDIVTFEKDDKYSIRNIDTSGQDMGNKLGMVFGEEETAKAIIMQQWQSKFHFILSPSFIYPIAWTNRNNEVETSPIAYEKTDEISSLIMAINPPINGIKYAKLKLPFRFLYYLTTSGRFIDFFESISKYKKEPYYFIYGAYEYKDRSEWIMAQGLHWLRNYDCRTGNWIQLPTQKAQTFGLYYNTSKELRVYNHSLGARIIGTPFSVALDTLTSPFQLTFILYFKLTGTMP
jgi:hypothetical protein